MKIPKVNIKAVKPHYVVAGGVILGFAAGGATGYLIAEKRLRAELYEKVDQELTEMREYYSKKYKIGEYETPEAAVEAVMRKDAENIAKDMGYIQDYDVEAVKQETMSVPEEPKSEEKIEVVKNVFVDPPADRTTRELEYEGWDYDNERARRAGKDIFIITQEEFFTNEPEHEQATLTWFEGDGVLVDERDMPIEDITQVIGTESMLKFGHGTKDGNTVHIRNNNLAHDVEIVRSHGKFSEEVAGFLQHSDDGHRKPPRKRWDDE